MKPKAIADALNRHCHCINVDHDRLQASLESRFGETGVWARLQESHPHLFADAPVFIASEQLLAMQAIVDAIASVVSLDAFQRRALDWAPAIARHDQGTQGVFCGYDFHLTNDGPRLIEINTNAGGAMLLLHLADAQQACCDAVENLVVGRTDVTGVEDLFIDMFRHEHDAVTSEGILQRVAIVDEDPDQQFLSPEFRLFQQVFRRNGIDAIVAAPDRFVMSSGNLQVDGMDIDLVYNRLTDFYLQSDACQALREAYYNNAAVITPSPRTHAIFANKRNLTLLSDRAWLRNANVDDDTIATLAAGVPKTECVVPRAADDLWSRRKQLYFKPACGFGSRGTYKGAKLTRKTWAGIVDRDYIAQQLVPPSERLVIDAGSERALKLDMRCFTYAGDIQLLGARLYRGQTTNFRTSGGGLASVFTTRTD